MDLTGEYIIEANRTVVWKNLNDPQILKQCIPGCETIVKSSDTEFEAEVTAKVGPVKAKFNGKVTLSEIDPPNSYVISGEGSGGAAGFAKGGARVSLSDDEAGTILTYTVDATVGGKLAQIGSRLTDAAAKKMAKDFFGAFAKLVETNEAPGDQMTEAEKTNAEDTATVQFTEQAANQKNAKNPGLRPVIWIPGLVVILLVMVLLFQS